jgi:hypothetical protein
MNKQYEQYPWSYSLYDKNDREIKQFHSFNEAWDYAVELNIACYILNNKVQSKTHIKWKRQ